jgi:hypothetical protein
VRRASLALALLAACGGPADSDAGLDTPTADAPSLDAPTTPHLDAPGTDAPAPPAEGVPLFVAIGKFGRITSSCDDGRSWGFDRSDDDLASCLGIDCDHHPGSSTGLTFGGGFFFASFGWGDHPARVFRSANGQDWELAYDQRGFSLAGLAWAEDRLVAGDPTPRYSLDARSAPALTFLEGAWPPYEIPEGAWPNTRTVAWAPHGGGRIAIVAAAGDMSFSDTVISSDGGLTFEHPADFPDACVGHGPRMAYGNGAWVQSWSTSGVVCTSLDGGNTFTATDLGDGRASGPIFHDGRFLLYVGRRGFRSVDGLGWTSFDVDVDVGAVAASPETGTIIALDGESWGRPYAEQRLYRSTDGGETFELLGATAFVHGHPLTHVVFGRGAASAACPAEG